MIGREFGAAMIEALESRLYMNAPYLSAAASAHSKADYIYARIGNKENAPAMTGQGGVALEGGGTDVAEAFQWMIGRMGGEGDFLVLSAVKDSGYDSYVHKLGGTNSVATLDIPSVAGANDPAVTAIITSADALFIEGGAQNNYLNFWKGTPVQAAIAADVARGVPIGGTSAGADVIGQFVYSALNNSVTSAAALANPFNSDMTFDENFISSSPPPASLPTTLPFLNNTLVDTHFITDDRTGRMTAFLARVETNGWSPNDQPMGIGINEQTALLINSDGTARVIGNDKATSPPQVDFFEAPSTGTPGFQLVCQAKTPLTYTPILEDTVLPGGTFNLNNWVASWHTTSTISVINGLLSIQSGGGSANKSAILGSPTISLQSGGNTPSTPTTPDIRVEVGMDGNAIVGDRLSDLELTFPKTKWNRLERL
jgi:cyanophycinase